MKTYFISGLGADSRAFKYLNLPAVCEPVFMEWLMPLKKESLENYAKRFSQAIDSSRPFILVGLSFGGILAIEMLNFIAPQKTILISSAANRSELPVLYKTAGFLRADKLLPPKATNRPNFFTYWLFGISDPADKVLLKDILTSSNSDFSKWAVHEILNWKRKKYPNRIIRIHGDHDRVLPIKNFKPDYIIKGGGHFMIVNKADEISRILAREISLGSPYFS